MAIFDITVHVITGGRPRIANMVEWLTENVGHYYGRGDGEVIHVGSGWEIVVDTVDHPGKEGGYTQTGWLVDITDEQKAMLFALKWL